RLWYGRAAGSPGREGRRGVRCLRLALGVLFHTVEKHRTAAARERSGSQPTKGQLMPVFRLLSRLDRDQPEVDLLRVNRLIDGNGARPEDVIPVIARLVDA